MTVDWEAFWETYRNKPAQNEADLFTQVGRTIDGEPIERLQFQSIIESMIEKLDLRKDDCLLDLCCGNGLCTYELAPHVDQIKAVDFSRHLISDARQFKSRGNIEYEVADITVPFDKVLGNNFYPSKILMNNALAYLQPKDLEILIKEIIKYFQNKRFVFLISDIPNDDLKFNFYNTPERKACYAKNLEKGDHTNDGVGRWWNTREIEWICNENTVQVKFYNQPDNISNYRMDALIWNQP